MIKLEKISRKEFCRQLEGKFLCMCGFRTHETFEEDLKVLEENQDYKGKQQYIFYSRSAVTRKEVEQNVGRCFAVIAEKLDMFDGGYAIERYHEKWYGFYKDTLYLSR